MSRGAGRARTTQLLMQIQAWRGGNTASETTYMRTFLPEADISGRDK